MNGNGVWKTATLTVLGMLVTGVSSWLMFGVDKMSRQEIFDYVEKHSPYVRDREVISRSLDQVLESNRSIQAELRSLVIEHARLGARVDMLQHAVTELQKSVVGGP